MWLCITVGLPGADTFRSTTKYGHGFHVPMAGRSGAKPKGFPAVQSLLVCARSLSMTGAQALPCATMSMLIGSIMKLHLSLFALMLLPMLAQAQEQDPLVYHPDALKMTTVAPGVTLKELSGLSATGSARSERVSVALFHLEPGHASAWSHNKNGEESFFVLKGNGSVWTGHRWQPVKPGSYVVIPASNVRSIRANKDESLDFYAITAPAWTADDDVHTAAPADAH